MQNYLLFNLYGPMAAWGKIAVGEMRHSESYPSKSAILGLIAAALGISRDQEEKLQALQDAFRFGVCVDKPGQLIVDYHTAQVPGRKNLKNWPHYTRKDELSVPALNTILSTREYYCDALYTIFLWQDKDNIEFTLESIAQALRNPIFTLYLGRKACPLALPLKPILINANSVEEALTKMWQDFSPKQKEILKYIGIAQKDKNLYWEGSVKDSGTIRIVRKDQLINRKRWQYRDREENHKVFSAGVT